MDHRGAQEWLDRYVDAWRTYDPDAITALFGPEATYRYHPYDEPVRGRDAVVASWLGESEDEDASARDEPGTYDARYVPVVVAGDAVIATGTSTYTDGVGGPVRDVFHNCFVLRFDEQGRCRDFTEWYVRQP